MKIYITHISRKIKNLREEKKLTQEELAEKLGISRQSIISVEKGKCLPSLPLALRISELFDLAFDEIFGNQKTHIKEEGEKIMPHPLTPWSPFGDLDRFFEDENASAWPSRRVIAFPAVNVKQKDKEVILTADIPGIKEDELQVEVGSDFVDISGERKEEEKIEEEGYFRQEVRYGSFARRILLPAEIKTGSVEATIKNGTLKLVMPKIEAAKPKVTKIKIKKA
ncbi:MAG: Hsp20 family protein [Patescibacteria group bacterium]|nr:Hsp20 family protein [Patescibacteria group bacterium]